jgi:hypothetical protein
MTTLDRELSGQVAVEIRALRKGRGLQAGDLDSRLGPLMRELADGADAAARRQALIAQINRCTEQLVDDYRVAIEADLALSAETKQEPYFNQRVSWLADRIGRDDRTALRHIDRAEQRLAELIAIELRSRRDRTPVSPQGWYLAELRTVLRIDTETFESEEDRLIVSTREDLTEVMAWFYLPRDANEPGADMQAQIRYGGRLVRKEQPSRNRFTFMIRLPHPLQPGQQHQYGLMLRMPLHMLRFSHYLVTPEYKFNKFDLRIRFDPSRLPTWIRRVDGETVRTFEDPQPTGDLLIPDAAGEVHQEFHDLTLYLGYGIQWKPTD